MLLWFTSLSHVCTEREMCACLYVCLPERGSGLTYPLCRMSLRPGTNRHDQTPRGRGLGRPRHFTAVAAAPRPASSLDSASGFSVHLGRCDSRAVGEGVSPRTCGTSALRPASASSSCSLYRKSSQPGDIDPFTPPTYEVK